MTQWQRPPAEAVSEPAAYWAMNRIASIRGQTEVCAPVGCVDEDCKASVYQLRHEPGQCHLEEGCLTIFSRAFLAHGCGQGHSLCLHLAVCT